jgi:hypothetical protein
MNGGEVSASEARYYPSQSNRQETDTEIQIRKYGLDGIKSITFEGVTYDLV